MKSLACMCAIASCAATAAAQLIQPVSQNRFVRASDSLGGFAEVIAEDFQPFNETATTGYATARQNSIIGPNVISAVMPAFAFPPFMEGGAARTDCHVVFNLTQPVSFEASGSGGGAMRGSGISTVRLTRLDDGVEIFFFPFYVSSHATYNLEGTLPAGSYNLFANSNASGGFPEGSTTSMIFEFRVVPSLASLAPLAGGGVIALRRRRALAQ